MSFLFGNKAPKAQRGAPKAPKFMIGGGEEEAADPLANVQYTGDLEVDSRLEAEALKDALVAIDGDRGEYAGYKDRQAREELRFAEANDSNYYTVLVFRNEAHRDGFLLGLTKQTRRMFTHQFGDDMRIIDGHKLWQLLGFEAPENEQYIISSGYEQGHDIMPPPGLFTDVPVATEEE